MRSFIFSLVTILFILPASVFAFYQRENSRDVMPVRDALPGGFGDKPIILTTIKPLTLIAKRLAGDDFEIRQLLSANENPHSLALSFRQRHWLDEAELVLWMGPDFERFLAKALVQESLQQRSLAAGNLPGLIEAGDNNQDLHLWLNPDNVARIYEVLAARLAVLSPLAQSAIDARLQDAKAELALISAHIEDQLTPLSGATFLVSHDAYSHFVKRFGLKQSAYATQVPEQQLAVKHVLAMRKSAQNAACLITEVNQPADIKLAEMLGLRAVPADVLGASADVLSMTDLYRGITQAFVACLGSS